MLYFFFFFQAEDGIRDKLVTGVQTCALPISPRRFYPGGRPSTRRMDFALTETQEITRKTVRDFAEQEIIPQSAAFDESQEFPHAWAKKMGELGLLGVFVPEKYGGAGLDTVCYAITI